MTLHPGVSPLNMVVDSGLMLIRIVPVNKWIISIDSGGREVRSQSPHRLLGCLGHPVGWKARLFCIHIKWTKYH